MFWFLVAGTLRVPYRRPTAHGVRLLLLRDSRVGGTDCHMRRRIGTCGGMLRQGGLRKQESREAV